MVKTLKYDLDTDTTLGGNNASDYIAPSQKAIKSYVDNHSGGGGSATDVRINNTSITNNGIANIVTNTVYNASSNKIATMSDIPENEIFIATYGTTFYSEITNAYGDGKAVFVKYVNGIYPLVGVNSNYVSFCGVRGTAVIYITCDSSSVLGWSIALSYTAEQTSNKTTSLSGSSTNTQYPSAKCVYDELVDKANVDLSNINQTAKNTVINTIMPDYANGISYTYTTALIEQSYTMPSDGYFSYTLFSLLFNKAVCYIKINDNAVVEVLAPSSNTGNYAPTSGAGLIPVNKNDVVKVRANYASGDVTKFGFFPMKGAE